MFYRAQMNDFCDRPWTSQEHAKPGELVCMVYLDTKPCHVFGMLDWLMEEWGKGVVEPKVGTRRCVPTSMLLNLLYQISPSGIELKEAGDGLL